MVLNISKRILLNNSVLIMLMKNYNKNSINMFSNLNKKSMSKNKLNGHLLISADNQPCINLIENKLGILSLLDEESRLPAGNDQSWIEKIYQTFNKEPTNKVFKNQDLVKLNLLSAIMLLDVTYDIDGFIEKNRDTVGEGHLDVMKESTNEILQSVLKLLIKMRKALEETSLKA